MRCRFAPTSDSVGQRALERFDARALHFFTEMGRAWQPETVSERLRDVDAHFELVSAERTAAGWQLDVRAPVPLRPLLARFTGLAPAEGRVVAERGARPFEQVCALVEELTGCDVSDARVRAGITRGHLIDIVVYQKACGASFDARAEQAAELAVDGCLGERVVDDWVLGIDTAPLPRGGSLTLLQPSADAAKTFKLSELGLAIERAVAGVYATLPPAPLHLEPNLDDWVLLEAAPNPDEAGAQADLMFASTCLPEMLKCYLQEAPFSSLRFSSHGERFLYLKYAASAELAERVRERQALEDALDTTLRGEGLGCVIGNGVGRSHCYVDLCVGDVDRALPVLCERARQFGLPEQSWVLFCDSEWAHEWVGIFDSAPPPAGHAPAHVP
jgi:hypothetical protein